MDRKWIAALMILLISLVATSVYLESNIEGGHSYPEASMEDQLPSEKDVESKIEQNILQRREKGLFHDNDGSSPVNSSVNRDENHKNDVDENVSVEKEVEVEVVFLSEAEVINNVKKTAADANSFHGELIIQKTSARGAEIINITHNFLDPNSYYIEEEYPSGVIKIDASDGEVSWILDSDKQVAINMEIATREEHGDRLRHLGFADPIWNHEILEKINNIDSKFNYRLREARNIQGIPYYIVELENKKNKHQQEIWWISSETWFPEVMIYNEGSTNITVIYKDAEFNNDLTEEDFTPKIKQETIEVDVDDLFKKLSVVAGENFHRIPGIERYIDWSNLDTQLRQVDYFYEYMTKQ